MTKLKLGVDLSFAKKRWPESEAWIDIFKNQFGLKYVEFDTDFLDPLFISKPTWMDIAAEINQLTAVFFLIGNEVGQCRGLGVEELAEDHGPRISPVGRCISFR